MYSNLLSEPNSKQRSVIQPDKHYFKISWFKHFLYYLECFSSQIIFIFIIFHLRWLIFQNERKYFFLWCGDGVIVKDHTIKLGSFLMKLFAMKTAISRSTVERTIRCFNETNNMKNCQIPGRPNISDLCRKTIGCCTIICRKFPSQHAQSKSATWHYRTVVQKILKKIEFIIRIKLIWYQSWTKMILIVVWNFANSWWKNWQWP